MAQRESDRVVDDCDQALHRLRRRLGVLATRNSILQLKVLALTSAGRHSEADSVLDILSNFDTSRLRAHIAHMRAQRDAAVAPRRKNPRRRLTRSPRRPTRWASGATSRISCERPVDVNLQNPFSVALWLGLSEQ